MRNLQKKNLLKTTFHSIFAKFNIDNKRLWQKLHFGKYLFCFRKAQAAKKFSSDDEKAILDAITEKWDDVNAKLDDFFNGKN